MSNVAWSYVRYNNKVYSICCDTKSFRIKSAIRRYTTNPIDQKNILDGVAKQLNVFQLSDWYKVNPKDLRDKIGSDLYSKYSSPSHLLSSTYPDYNWLPWKFARCPLNYWNDLNNQRKFLEWLRQELQLKEMNDWYNVSFETFRNYGGASLLMNQYAGSPFRLLCAVYPEYSWLPWKFHNCPRNFWNNLSNQKMFLDWAGKELGIKEMDDWYRVSYKDFSNLGGKSLLNQYSGSLSTLLSAIYPQHNWQMWKFNQVTANWWTSNAKVFMEKAARELNISSMEDWYNVSREDITKLEGGNKILTPYKYSVYNILKTVFPDYRWLPWKFPYIYDHWADTNNVKIFMDSIAKELNINDWKTVKPQQIIDLGGGPLLVRYKSLALLIASIYPQQSCENVGDVWKDENLARYFVESIKSESEVVYVNKVIQKLRYQEGFPLTTLLKASFPNFVWETVENRKTQFILKEHLKKILTGEVLENYKHPDILNLELDYFYPQFKIAFEYQGQQHYRNVRLFHRQQSLDSHQTRDKTKVEICQEKGITLVEIPYWWDRKLSSLEATIYNLRPDLFQVQPKGHPIPPFPSEAATIQSKGAKVLMTATEWEDNMEAKGWFMTEKYDGMRLYWNGKQFFSRQGETVSVPESIVSKMPPVALDGELWTQYGLYQDAVQLAKSKNEEKWNKAVYWIFDSPEIGDKALEERIDYLKQLQLPSFAKIVEFVKCEGKDHLHEFYTTIQNKGGEGVMLREPRSLYKPGRSTSLRKYKKYLDTEVKVVKSQYPHGFICKQANGKEVFVKITDSSEGAKQVKEGAVVTVKYSGVNVYGTLQYPQFYRERLDVNWKEVNNK